MILRIVLPFLHGGSCERSAYAFMRLLRSRVFFLIGCWALGSLGVLILPRIALAAPLPDVSKQSLRIVVTPGPSPTFLLTNAQHQVVPLTTKLPVSWDGHTLLVSFAQGLSTQAQQLSRSSRFSHTPWIATSLTTLEFIADNTSNVGVIARSTALAAKIHRMQQQLTQVQRQLQQQQAQLEETRQTLQDTLDTTDETQSALSRFATALRQWTRLTSSETPTEWTTETVSEAQDSLNALLRTHGVSASVTLSAASDDSQSLQATVHAASPLPSELDGVSWDLTTATVPSQWETLYHDVTTQGSDLRSQQAAVTQNLDHLHTLQDDLDHSAQTLMDKAFSPQIHGENISAQDTQDMDQIMEEITTVTTNDSAIEKIAPELSGVGSVAERVASQGAQVFRLADRISTGLTVLQVAYGIGRLISDISRGDSLKTEAFEALHNIVEPTAFQWGPRVVFPVVGDVAGAAAETLGFDGAFVAEVVGDGVSWIITAGIGLYLFYQTPAVRHWVNGLARDLWHDITGGFLQDLANLQSDQAEIYAPDLYLWTPQNQPFTITLAPTAHVVFTNVPLVNHHWQGLATPTHQLIWPHHAPTPTIRYTLTTPMPSGSAQGWIIRRADFAVWARRTLGSAGWPAPVVTAFIHYWQSRLPQAPWLGIHAVAPSWITQHDPLTITPRPQHLRRFWVEWIPLAHPLPWQAPSLAPAAPHGWTVYEWGGFYG